MEYNPNWKERRVLAECASHQSNVRLTQTDVADVVSCTVMLLPPWPRWRLLSRESQRLHKTLLPPISTGNKYWRGSADCVRSSNVLAFFTLQAASVAPQDLHLGFHSLGMGSVGKWQIQTLGRWSPEHTRMRMSTGCRPSFMLQMWTFFVWMFIANFCFS